VNSKKDEPFVSGIPMDVEPVHLEQFSEELPRHARLVSLDEARESLEIASSTMCILQSLSEEAHDLTNELEILLEQLDVNDEHVVQVAEQLACLVAQWQGMVEELELTGARIASLDLGRLEWYGIVDDTLAIYSWMIGEHDIEWYHDVHCSFQTRKPLIEA